MLVFMKVRPTLLVLLVFCQSCVVQYPPYANVQDVQRLQPGVSLDSVNAILRMPPNDLVVRDSLQTVYLYKYRVDEVKTVSPGFKRNKGLKVEGTFKECLVTVDTTSTVQSIATRDEAVSSMVKKEKVKVTEILDTVTTFLSVTIPAILVYLTVDGNG